MDRKLGGLIAALCAIGTAHGAVDMTATNAAWDAYNVCLAHNWPTYAASDGTATEAAQATMGACATEAETFHNVMRNNLVSLMRTPNDKARAAMQADAVYAQKQSETQNALIAAILEARTKAKSQP